MSFSCFFYGTLMHPAVLTKDHTRHHVKDADYPGVVPYEQSKEFFRSELERDEKCVRGSIVTGLNKRDIALLDHFEGSWYDRRPVKVHPLMELWPISTGKRHTSNFLTPSPLPDELPNAVDAYVYIWIAPLNWLKPDLWDYETFVKEKLRLWVGKDFDPSKYEDEYEGPKEPTETERVDVITERKARRASQDYKNSNSGY